jgi:exodeoxyribonuclease V alpha subunit
MHQTVVQESLSGSIERITFHNAENGFCILKIKVKSKEDLVTVLGFSACVTAGEFVECRGAWINDVEYGLQFKAEHLHLIRPSSLEGIEKYLGSGLIRGIGPGFAKRLVKAFGEHTFEVIEEEPHRLAEVPGLGLRRRTGIIATWADQKLIRAIMVFLQSHGVGTSRAVRIFKTYGSQAIEIVQANPYRLALDIRGIGFKTADELAKRLGVAQDSLFRLQAGLLHVLQEHSSEGHCAMPKALLLQTGAELLGVPESLLNEALLAEQKEERVVLEPIEGVEAVFLKGFYRAEKGIAWHIKRLQSQKVGTLLLEEALNRAQQQTGLELSDSQRQAMKVVLEHKCCIITGGPGVGKTTLVKSLLAVLKQDSPRILLAAPTGRAAKRLSESTGMEAKTLHRLLEFDPSLRQFKQGEHNPLEADLIVLDEVSMVDVLMMHAFLKAVPDAASIIWVGDVDQLPSVGPGAVLADLMGSGCIATVRLTEIFRQAQQSQIIINAHRVNRGQMPILDNKGSALRDFYFIKAAEPEDIYQKLFEVVGTRIPQRFGLDPVRDVQVLTPMNRSGLGARALNVALQKHFNPHPIESVTRFGTVYAKSDKVIQTVNNYQKEVFNGDIGFITEVNLEEGLIRVLFEGRLIEYEFNDLDELALAYATSIHKSQGSEYPAIVIPLAMQHYRLLERNLLYTAMTRGQSLVVIIGQVKALGIAVKTLKSSQRLGNLQYRLQLS